MEIVDFVESMEGVEVMESWAIIAFIKELEQIRYQKNS
jgi:hypothetical protein